MIKNVVFALVAAVLVVGAILLNLLIYGGLIAFAGYVVYKIIVATQ